MVYRNNVNILPIALIALLCAATPTIAVPASSTGRSNTLPESGSVNCDAVLSSGQIQSLRTEIVASTSALIAALGGVHVWSPTVSWLHIIIITNHNHNNNNFKIINNYNYYSRIIL